MEIVPKPQTAEKMMIIIIIVAHIEEPEAYVIDGKVCSCNVLLRHNVLAPRSSPTKIRFYR